MIEQSILLIEYYSFNVFLNITARAIRPLKNQTWTAVSNKHLL